MKKTLKIIAVNLIVFCLLLLALEGLARVWVPSADRSAVFDDRELRMRGRPFVQFDPKRGFALVPGFKNRLYAINSLGFRGEEFPADLERREVVLAMGESTTFGWEVPDNATYPYALNCLLNHGGSDYYVINGGVPSYTSSQVRIYLDELLSARNFKVDLVLVNIMWNDIWYSSVANWNPNILVFQQPPSWMRFLLRHSRFVSAVLTRLGASDATTDRFNEAALSQYRDNLVAIIARCREAHVKLAFVEPPLDADHLSDAGLAEFRIHYSKPFLISMGRRYWQTLHQIANRYGVPVVSQRLGLSRLHQHELFIDALHPTPQGNALMAADISERVREMLQ